MNNKAFTLIEVLSTIVIMGIITLVVVPLISRKGYENQQTLYHEYENMIEEYAKFGQIYGNDDHINLADIPELSKISDECDGYAVIDHDNNDNYKAYISCSDKYKTDGYDEKYNK